MATAPMILQRIGSRERRFIGLVLVVALVAATVAGTIYMGTIIAEVEQTLEEGEFALEEIRVSAEEYLDSMRKKRALETAIQDNKTGIQTAIDAIAKKVEVTRLGGVDGEQSSFDKVLRYEAKTTERPILLGEKKKKSRDKSSDYFELSQPTEYSFVKFIDLMTFLEQIESPDHLMYISKLEVTRKYMDPEFVQGQLTVSTFIYKPQKEEEEEE
jgi:hypothetical protein